MFKYRIWQRCRNKRITSFVMPFPSPELAPELMSPHDTISSWETPNFNKQIGSLHYKREVQGSLSLSSSWAHRLFVARIDLVFFFFLAFGGKKLALRVLTVWTRHPYVATCKPSSGVHILVYRIPICYHIILVTKSVSAPENNDSSPSYCSAAGLQADMPRPQRKTRPGNILPVFSLLAWQINTWT